MFSGPLPFPYFRYDHAELVVNRERIGSFQTTLLSELGESILQRKLLYGVIVKMLHLYLLQNYAVLHLRDYLIINNEFKCLKTRKSTKPHVQVRISLLLTGKYRHLATCSCQLSCTHLKINLGCEMEFGLKWF